MLALTATATPRVQHDTAVQLGLESCLLFRSSFNRPNLSYEVIPKKQKTVEQVQVIADLMLDKFTSYEGNRKTLQCGIIYCFSKKNSEEVAAKLDDIMRTKLGSRRGSMAYVK